MAVAKIDVQGMGRVVSGLESGIETLDDARTTLRSKLSQFNLDTSRSAALLGPADWARDELPAARRRLALAQALEGSNPSWEKGKVQLDDVTDITSMDPDKAQQAGKEAAEALRDCHGKPDDEILAQLEEMQNDPYFAAGLASELTPDELATIALSMGTSQVTPEQAGNSDEAAKQNAWYAGALSSLSTTLATATRSTGDLALPSTYAQGWLDAITADVPGTPYYEDGDGQKNHANALGLLLTHGNFDKDFLGTVANGVYDYERRVGDERGKVWGPRGDDTVGPTGTYYGAVNPDGSWFTDPMVGIMSALGRTPGASADFFNPDGGGAEATDRAKYLIQDRTWTADDFNSIAEALDAAATTYHSTDATVAQQTQSAWIASATVHYFGERDGGRHDRAIGDAGKDSLAHLFSSYLSDVDRVAVGTDDSNPPSTSSPQPTAPWEDGRAVGADFRLTDLNKVLGEVLTDDGALAELADASARFNAARVNAAVDAWNKDPANENYLQGSVQTSAALNGYLLGNLERASKAAGKEVDDRNKAFVDFASDVVGLVPTGGTVASFVADQAKSAGKDWLEEYVSGHEAQAESESFDAQQQTLDDMQSAIAAAIVDSPRATNVHRDSAGTPYPWFGPDGTIDQNALKDPETLNEFRIWTRSGGAGDQVTTAVPDLSASYNRGITRGRGSN